MPKQHTGENSGNINPTNPVSTTRTSFEILEFLLRSDGASLVDITDEIGMAKSTVHRHISTLHQDGYVVKEDDLYYPGLQLLEFGEYLLNRKDEYPVIRAKVDELSEHTGERTVFMVEENGVGVYIHTADSDQPRRTDPRRGKQIPMHGPAGGKAILAALPDSRIHDIVDRHGLDPITQKTITDRADLFDEIERIRDRGYSINEGETVEGLTAFAVPIVKQASEVVGSICISGPTNRFGNDQIRQDVVNELRSTKNEIEISFSSGSVTRSFFENVDDN